MKKLVLFAALALFGFCYVFAQNVDLVDYQRGNETENFLSVNDNEFGDSTQELDTDNPSNLIFTNIQFGLAGGIVNSDIVGDQADSYDCRTCFTAGFLVLMPIDERWALQPELNYACMGADYRDVYGEEYTNRSLVDYSGTVKLSYLQLPVMAKYYIVDGLSLEAGPQIAFLLSATDEFEFMGESGEEDISDLAKGVEFGFNAGLGYKFDAGYHVRARYLLGLSEINDTEIEPGASWKNSSFQLSVGYFF